MSDVADDGAMALKMYRDAAPGTYDAVLMDIRMPEMNGYEAARAIRGMKREDAGRIPIIAMTANAFAEDVQDALDAGMDAHVAKPIDMEILKTENLKKYYGKGVNRVKALDGVSLTVEEGELLFIEKTAEVIDALAGKAKEAGVKLCLKNEYWGLLRGEKIVPFVEQLKNDVYLDVDTAYLQIAGVNVPEFIKANKDKIGVVHFTDTSFVDDQEAYLQALPEFPAKAATKVICDIGEGKVDFKAVMAALEETGYEGQIVYNCKDSYDVSRSLLRTRYFIDKVLA